MKPKTSLHFCIILVLLFCGNAFAQSQNVEKAKELWEKVITAKGGREKLYSIGNMLVSSTNSKDKLQKTKKLTENFFVFPNKEWQWDDERPSVFGLRMSMRNWETGTHYIVQDNGDPKEQQLEPIDSEKIKNLRTVDGIAKWAGLVIYFPETRWWKTNPLSVSEEKIGSYKVDVIQTQLFEKTIDFYLDKQTHLPLRIRFHNFLSTRNVIDTNTVELSDYAEVAGIKVPMKIKENDGEIYKLNYQFNVEYEESIFTTPPSVEAGSEAWKPKVKE